MFAKRKPKEATIFAVDCGKSMDSHRLDNGFTYFEATKQCIECIVKQKLFAQTPNEYLLVEFSTEGVVGIKPNDRLRIPGREFFQYINDKLRPMITDGPNTNVMDALNETISLTTNETRAQIFTAINIILFTDFSELEEQDFDRFVDQISNKLTFNLIQLFVVCPFRSDSFSDRKPTASQIVAIKLMKYIEERKIGNCFDFEDITAHFGLFQGHKVSPINSYLTLELGSDPNALKIPIGWCLKVVPSERKAGKIPFLQPERPTIPIVGPTIPPIVSSNPIQPPTLPIPSTSSTEPVPYTPIAPIISGQGYNQLNTGSQPEVRTPVVTYGYRYGQSVVPIGDEDSDLFKYDKLQKGMRIIGFTGLTNIDFCQRRGVKTYYMFADPRPVKAYHRFIFQTLVDAMIRSESAAIVRYNYSDRSNPQIGSLVPLIEDNMYLLVYHQLPFAEDFRNIRFPSLAGKAFTPSEEQLNSIDNLIDSMDLTNADSDPDGNPCEALNAYKIADPSLQHWFETLFRRRLSRELPQMSDYVKKLIKTPEEVIQRSKVVLNEMIDIFNLNDNQRNDSKEQIKRRRLE